MISYHLSSSRFSFLIHYGWRGTVPLLPFPLPLLRVSNPLRLEGDSLPQQVKEQVRMFLIHYGWRGTKISELPEPEVRLFLIHYGWRGTPQHFHNGGA